MLGTIVGLVEFGEEQETARIKAERSLVTFGMKAPKSEIFVLALGIAYGVYEVTAAAVRKIRNGRTGIKYKTNGNSKTSIIVCISGGKTQTQ